MTVVRWSRVLVYLLPAVVAGVGALVGLLSAGQVRPLVALLTFTLIGLGFVVPPVVDWLRARHERVAADDARRAAQWRRAAAERGAQVRDHFEPRGRGVLPTQVRSGLYFTGRVRALDELTGWIRGVDSDCRARVLTGGPGAGKSAVLGRLIAVGMPSVLVAVHCRGLTPDEVAVLVGGGLEVDVDSSAGLLAALRAGPRPAVVVVDAIDEAVNPLQLVQDLLEPLAASGDPTGLRCVFGTRRGGDGVLLRAFGDAAVVIDLDSPDYFDHADVEEYVRRTLLAEPNPQLRTPYRDRPDLAGPVARAVAVRAGTSFLVAQLTALSLVGQGEPVDTTEPGWAKKLPASVSAAMDRYLRDAASDETWVRDLLRPLAWAQGDGLDDFAVWAAIATALGTAAYSDVDIARLLFDTRVVDLLHRSVDADRINVRMFHEALAEQLRQDSIRYRPAAEIHRRVANVLIGRVQQRSGGGRDWSTADNYTRQHLPTHAAAGSILDGLLHEPGFLVAADPARLLPSLASVATAGTRRVARIVERVGQQLLLSPLEERVCYLEMAAHMAGDESMAHQFRALPADRPWSVQWARWNPLDESHVLGHHDDYVHAVHTVATTSGTIVVAASDWTVRAWWLHTGTPVEATIGHPHSSITDMAAYADGGDVIVVTAHADGDIRRSTVFASTAPQTLLNSEQLSGLWLIEHHGRPTLVCDLDQRVTVIDPTDGSPVGLPSVDVAGGRVLTAATIDGRPLLAFAAPDLSVEVRDLTTGQTVGASLRPSVDIPGWDAVEPMWSAALGSIDGRPVMLTGGPYSAPHVVLWDPQRASMIGDTGFHSAGGAVSALIFGDGRPLLAIGDTYGDVFVRGVDEDRWRWFAAHDNAVASIAADHLDGADVLVTGGRDGTVRLWRPDHAHRRPADDQHVRRTTLIPAHGDRSALVAILDEAGRCSVLDTVTGQTLTVHEPEPGDRFRDLATIHGAPPALALLHLGSRISIRPPLDQLPSRELILADDADFQRLNVANTEPQMLLLRTTDANLAFVSLATGDETRPRIRCHTTPFGVFVDPESPPGAIRFVTTTWLGPQQLTLWTVDATSSQRIDLETKPQLDPEPSQFFIGNIAFSRHHGQRLIAGVGSYANIHLWTTETGRLQYATQLKDAHGKAINAIEIATVADRTYLLTGGHTCTLGFWSLDNQEEHHLWIGSQLWFIHALPDLVVVAGVRGVMAIQLGTRPPG